MYLSPPEQSHLKIAVNGEFLSIPLNHGLDPFKPHTEYLPPTISPPLKVYGTPYEPSPCVW
jgi:hypothetical protein